MLFYVIVLCMTCGILVDTLIELGIFSRVDVSCAQYNHIYLRISGNMSASYDWIGRGEHMKNYSPILAMYPCLKR